MLSRELIDHLREIVSRKRGGEPTYKSLAGALRMLIETGKLKPGDRLPTQREAAAALSLSVHTVQHGYNQLIRDRFLIGRQGVRTVVAEPPSQRRLRLAMLPDY